MLANVTTADRTEQRIRNCVRENIGIRMPLQSEQEWNFHAAQNQLSILDEPMHIVTDAGADPAHNFKSITPLEAMMLYLSFMSLRGRRSTLPPALSTKIQPAAMSHKLIPCSM